MQDKVRRPYTVSELINHLWELPQDSPVVFSTDKENTYVRTMIVEPYISTLGRGKVVMITGCFKPDVFPLNLSPENYLEYIGPRLTNKVCEYLAIHELELTLENIAKIRLEDFRDVRNVGKILTKRFEEVQEELKLVLIKTQK